MAHHGLESQIVVADADFTEAAGYRGAARLLRDGRPITAIAAVNDLAAVGAMSAVADAGLRIPATRGHRLRRHLRLRDPPGVADLGQPDSSRIGSLAAQCVLRRIEDPNGPRRSTCCRRGWFPGTAPVVVSTLPGRTERWRPPDRNVVTSNDVARTAIQHPQL